MKLQKQLSKKYGNKKYYRYSIAIPNELIEKSELKEGDELDADASKHQITLKKSLK